MLDKFDMSVYDYITSNMSGAAKLFLGSRLMGSEVRN